MLQNLFTSADMFDPNSPPLQKDPTTYVDTHVSCPNDPLLDELNNLPSTSSCELDGNKLMSLLADAQKSISPTVREFVLKIVDDLTAECSPIDVKLVSAQ